MVVVVVLLCCPCITNQKSVLLPIQPIRGNYYCDDKSEARIRQQQINASHLVVQMSVCRSIQDSDLYSELHFRCVVNHSCSTFQRNIHTNLWMMESNLKVGKRYINWHQYLHVPQPSIILKQDQKSKLTLSRWAGGLLDPLRRIFALK